MGDALALREDEGRDKLRKATMSRKWAILIVDVRMGEPD